MDTEEFNTEVVGGLEFECWGTITEFRAERCEPGWRKRANKEERTIPPAEAAAVAEVSSAWLRKAGDSQRDEELECWTVTSTELRETGTEEGEKEEHEEEEVDEDAGEEEGGPASEEEDDEGDLVNGDAMGDAGGEGAKQGAAAAETERGGIQQRYSRSEKRSSLIQVANSTSETITESHARRYEAGLSAWKSSWEESSRSSLTTL